VAKARNARTVAEARLAAGIPGGGAIRASVGLASNIQDVQMFLAVTGAMYRDRRCQRVPACPAVQNRDIPGT
jgi:hypothetical protein